ncbi:MAG: diaminopimelate epimerase [Steroidobacteraceae bacterium]
MFSKYHALGNDYLVVPYDAAQAEPSVSLIERLCNRHYGIGSDGILLGPLPSTSADFGLRIFNPDGSEAEKSGNGLRIFCRYLWDQGLVKDRTFTIETKGGVVRAEVLDQGRSIKVAMGRVSFHSRDIPVIGAPREVLQEALNINGRQFEFSAVTIGNPHCVIRVPEVSAELARHYGPLLERHSLFPNRTNVQFVQILDRHSLRIEIWERGAGYTLASGSSSCAAAAVAHRLQWCDAQMAVSMPGGSIAIDIDSSFLVTMTGPVTKVFDATLAEESLA